MEYHPHDLSKPFDDNGYAKFLPAISGFYIKQINKVRKDPTFYDPERIPSGLEYGIDGMDFFKKEGSYFFYKYGLYSAGHARRDLPRAIEEECMIHKRNRDDTVLVGDSGGYQLAKGIIKMDWDNAKDPHDPRREQLCGEILEWLEGTSEWSMTLDIPAWMTAVPSLVEKTGLSSFDDALAMTQLNLDYFIEHRTPEKTKFLNVISGSDAATSKKWYEGVKQYSDPDKIEEMGFDRDRTLEGYAFAGIHMRDMYVALSRILDLIDDDLISDKDWRSEEHTSELQSR